MPPVEELSREELLALVAAQAETIEALRVQVVELTRRLSRNSGNSSMPPSSDGVLPGRAVPRRGGGGGGKKGRRGKRPGDDGMSLTWSDAPDRTVAHYPSGRCGCGVELAEAAVVGVARSHQVHDVPLVTATVTRHDLHRVRCGCGAVHVAAAPGGVSRAPMSYGPNLRALVVYLLVFQHLPVERAALLVAEVTGAAPSTGFVHGLLARAAGAVAPAVERIRELVVGAAVAGFDETTLRVGPAGAKRYVLSASTERCALFGLGGRDLASFQGFGVLSKFRGIAVHDRYSLYDHDEFAAVGGHQLCVSHLLRDLEDVAEAYPDAHWPRQAQEALRGLVHAWHAARHAGKPAIPARVSGPLIDLFGKAVRVGLAQVPPADGPRSRTRQPVGRVLLECLRDRENDVLRFTTDTRVWPTNNTSERDLRPTKTQQKISGRLTSDTTTEHRLALRSYLATARKHGWSALAVLRDALTGSPWLPPLTAPT